MPLPKGAVVQTFATGPSTEASSELWNSIHQLLVFANVSRNENSDGPLALRAFLTALADARKGWNPRKPGQPASFKVRGWPAQLALGAWNLVSIVRQNDNPKYYVRECPRCGRWFLSHSASKKYCHSKECFRTAESRRVTTYKRRVAEETKQELEALRASLRRPGRTKSP